MDEIVQREKRNKKYGIHAEEGEEDGPLCESCAGFDASYGDISGSAPTMSVSAGAGCQFIAIEFVGDDGLSETIRLSVGDAQDLRDAIDEASEMAAKEVA